jgi:hypothetical protein
MVFMVFPDEGVTHSFRFSGYRRLKDISLRRLPVTLADLCHGSCVNEGFLLIGIRIGWKLTNGGAAGMTGGATESIFWQGIEKTVARLSIRNRFYSVV